MKILSFPAQRPQVVDWTLEPSTWHPADRGLPGITVECEEVLQILLSWAWRDPHRWVINEHTASAGEMVSAFAEENNLATIVGTKTPGRLLSGSAYKVGHGYILGLPIAAYLTWQGRMLENNGIVPKFSIELSRDALKDGRDTQLETAIEVVKAL